MNVAKIWPPRIDGSTGRVSYRISPNGGWTENYRLAHPSYSVESCPPGECIQCGVRTFDEHRCDLMLEPREPRIPGDEEAAILLDLQTPFWRQFMANADWDDES